MTGRHCVERKVAMVRGVGGRKDVVEGGGRYAAAAVHAHVPENLNQRVTFSSSIVTRRIGDTEAQYDRYAGG